MAQNGPVSVDVIAYAPTAFYHCQHCELTFQEMGLGERLRRDAAASSLPDDLAGEYQALSDWIHHLIERYGGAIRLKLIDAASVEGFVASVRHRIGRYPTVVVDGRDKSTGSDFAAIEPLIERRVASARVRPPTGGERRDASQRPS